MRRWVGLLPIAGLALVAWWLLGVGRKAWDAGQPRVEREPATIVPLQDRREIEGAALQGAPDARVARPPVRHDFVVPDTPARRLDASLRRLRGTARTPDGAVPPGLEVWRVHGARPEGSNARTSLSGPALVEADGSFHVDVAGTDWWIGARAHGWGIVFLKGADLPDLERVEVVLPPIVEIAVRVVDAQGDPVSGVLLHATPAGREGHVPRWPGPESPLPVASEFTDQAGVATFLFDRPTPLSVEVQDLRTEPPRLRLRCEDRSGLLVTAPPTRLVLEVRDRASGDHVSESVHVELLDERGAGLPCAIKTDASPDVIEADLPLGAGTYAFKITARGREPVLLEGVEVPGPALEIRRTVDMEPLAPGARLEIEVASEDPAAGQPSQWVLWPLVLVRRTDGGWGRLGFDTWPVEGYGTGAYTLGPLRPGTYDVALLLPQQGQAATASGIVLAGGATRRVRVAPSSASSAAVHALLPPDLEVASLRVMVPGEGRLPVVGRVRSTPLRTPEDLVRAIAPAGSAARRVAAKGPVLGPYPGPFVVRVWDPEGREYHFRVP